MTAPSTVRARKPKTTSGSESSPGKTWLQRKRLAGWGWVLPALAIICFVQFIPIAYAVWLSLFEKRALAPSGTFVGLGNYVQHLSSPDFWRAVRVGVVYAAGSVTLQLILGLATALLLNRSFKGRGLARTAALLPYMVPTATAALVFSLMFNDLYGIVNQVLMGVGLISEPILFFGDEFWVMPAIILAAAWKWTPFALIVLLARLQAIDASQYESARVEGAGPVRTFIDITLPSLKGAIFLIILLRSIWMFNKFDIPYLLTKGGPIGATENLPIYAYNVNFLQLQQGDGAALAVIMSLLLLVFAVPYFLIFRPEKEVSAE